MEQFSLVLTRLWHRARRPLTRSRAVFMWLNRRRPSRSNLLVRPESVLLIEAPMRSGNTFAAAAFMLMNPDAGHVARHIHTAAHVREAVRLGLPALVIVRDPRDVAVSHVLRRPALTVADSLVDYAQFFEDLEPVRNQVVAATFEEVTERFDSVIERLNERFGTSFAVRPIDESFRSEVMARIEQMNREERAGDGKIDELRVARPSAKRERLRAGPAAQLEHPRNRTHLDRALKAHESWS